VCDNCGHSPVNVRSAPTEWAYTDVPCAYVVAMIDGWKTDDPSASGRHPSLQDRAVRLTAAHRRGCLTEQLHDQGRRVLAATMR